MDETFMNKLLSSIQVPTEELSSKTIQDVLVAAKRQSQIQQVNKVCWNEVTQALWNHLLEGLHKFDDQLLCATCFYTVLGSTDDQETYLSKILNIVNEEIELRDKHSKMNANTLQVVSLMYGMFQSLFLVQETRKDEVVDLLKIVFKLLMQMSYEYSKYTFIVFKTINSFKKVCGTDLQEILFSEQNTVKLLNVTNHNWENPITGVRDLIKGIFQTLISVMDEEMYKNVLKEVNGFYWNKAKYLMLAEIISNKGISNIAEYDWIDGLINSLYKPGLVSAGADMYFELFKKIHSENDWCKLFKKPILDLLCGASQKGIENFSNYWILTTFKSYPTLAETLLRELKYVKETENKLYSSLCLIKQANKLDLINKTWENAGDNHVEKTVKSGLDHTNCQIRLMAFDIICVSHSKSLPTNIEYELVLDFITNNVNSDCTVLRISMLKSLSSFLTQIHMAYLNYLKDGNETGDLKQFCFKFQQFIINNMKIGGNYQRKVTSIKLAHTFLNCLKELPRKRQKQTRKCEKSIIQMLKDCENWLMADHDITLILIQMLKDPAEDIRENVIQLLFDHYSEEIGTTDLMNHLIEDALKSMSSKFFYEINCGQSAFKLIINILLKKEQLEARFRQVGDVFDYAFKELITEYHMKRSIVESIEKGKQMYSFISIIQAVFEVCHQKKESLNISNETLMILLEVLEGISNQFAWESETSTSSDFSKMSDMVNNLILISGHNNGGNNQTKISGLHQIVLNCLWLNVKGACELSSLLIKYQNDDQQIGVCGKALDIICHVLETCRHKGAIEAAGASLGQSIQHLTSLPEQTALTKLPLSFLKIKLNELISEAASMASVTRRGAGLSIMVHRIVSSDAKRGKPLFHYFMKTILEACNKAEVPQQQNIDNAKDLPKAIYIHFLTRIVTDSSLASDIMFYSSELAELAFGNLTSPYWQIRNAALQLYGALIQKLIGQKKASGTDEQTVATVACDELRTHSPILWKYVLDQLKNKNYDDKIQYHSNLVPILNMLANIAKRYNFSSDTLEQKEEYEEMLATLIWLIDSPIYTVRRLTANCISNLFNFEDVYDTLLKQECLSENYLHGSLMLIESFHKLYSSNKENTFKFQELNKKYADILNGNEHSYLCQELFESIFCADLAEMDKIYLSESDKIKRMYAEHEKLERTFEELKSNSHKPGVFLWANKRVQKCIKYAPWEMVPEILKMIIIQNESETYLSMLLEKLEKTDYITEGILLRMIDILLENKYASSYTWMILYNLAQKSHAFSVNKVVDIFEVYQYLKESGASYKLRYMIPVVARFSAMTVHIEANKFVRGAKNDIIDETCRIIKKLIHPENDVEMRLIAAKANNELASNINELHELVIISAIKCAVILLQDEDEDVRVVSTEFYTRATNCKQSLQPYICLRKILNHSFLDKFLRGSISILAMELNEYLLKVCSKNVDEYNPFANDSSNIYLEVNVLRHLIENL